MFYSKMLENMFAPYEYELVKYFCDSMEIYLFIDSNFPNSPYAALTDNEGNIEYRFRDPKTFYFHLKEDTLYGGRHCVLVTFRHTEEEVMNKFHRFMKMKAFL